MVKLNKSLDKAKNFDKNKRFYWNAEEWWTKTNFFLLPCLVDLRPN